MGRFLERKQLLGDNTSGLNSDIHGRCAGSLVKMFSSSNASWAVPPTVWMILAILVATAAVPQRVFADVVKERLKAVRLILQTGDIDLINSKVQDYDDFKEILVGTAVGLTIEHGTPVQFHYARTHYGHYWNTLSPHYAAMIERSTSLIMASIGRILSDQKPLFLNSSDVLVISADVAANRQSFLEVYEIPDLKELVDDWLYTNDTILPVLLDGDSVSTARVKAVQDVVSDEEKSKKDYFTSWVNAEVLSFCKQAPPDTFFAENADLRTVVADVLVMNGRNARSDSPLASCLYPFVVKAISGIQDSEGVAQFLLWLEKSQQLAWIKAELGGDAIESVNAASKPCPNCFLDAVLLDYLCTLLTGRSCLDDSTVDEACVSTAEVACGRLVQAGVNVPFVAQVERILKVGTSLFKDETDLQRFLQRYKDLYWTVPSAVDAFTKAKTDYEARLLHTIKKRTKPRGKYKTTSNTESYTIPGQSYCASTRQKAKTVCARCNPKVWVGCDCLQYKTVYEDVCDWKTGPSSVGYNTTYNSTIDVSFLVRNPSSNKIEVLFSFSQSTSCGLIPPTSVVVGPHEKVTVSKRESSNCGTSDMRLLTYEVSGVHLVLEGEHR